MHAAFLDYVKQVLMPTPIPGDSVIMDNSVDRRLVAIVSGITNVSFGSNPEVQHGPRNVRSWGQSGLQIWAATCLLVAKTGCSSITRPATRLLPLDYGGRCTVRVLHEGHLPGMNIVHGTR